DIALLTKCGRMESEKYRGVLAKIATDLAMKYFAVVNFVCLPKEEYNQKKAWYSYFRNIDREGVRLYGR
ncbi:MAG: toxin-antitoxin system, toxin component, partial [Ruminococcus flavefaciens]|nr:toxin-antitoxin system, toxin component [Ruminococcus flavefaciens]